MTLKSKPILMATISVFLGLFLFVGCASFTDSSADKAPVIDSKLSIAELTKAGIDFGDKTIIEVKKELTKRQAWPEASKVISSQIQKNHSGWSSFAMINAVNLYVASSPEKPEILFQLLLKSDKPVVRQVAWHIASILASPAIKTAAEAELTSLIERNTLQENYFPQLAKAIAANQLEASYSLLREGLLFTHSDAYADAMIQINPRQASSDFLDYLSLVSVEELRQISITSINVYTAMGMFRHLMKYPVEISHPKFDHIFLYAISRNIAFKNIGRDLLEVYIVENRNHLALVLSRMPIWIQLAFVEGSRHQLNPVVGRLLSELKTLSREKAVVDEINSIRL
jgi:hypothetical protein